MTESISLTKACKAALLETLFRLTCVWPFHTPSWLCSHENIWKFFMGTRCLCTLYKINGCTVSDFRIYSIYGDACTVFGGDWVSDLGWINVFQPLIHLKWECRVIWTVGVMFKVVEKFASMKVKFLFFSFSIKTLGQINHSEWDDVNWEL